ncbi:hypothetical protein Fcan01_10726 [Folsomia candida]|uniref:Uncharacterized protein n=1 Tax=Folsomia candida TaxID=158441 RepID=A0A226E8G1_FOLCA|nr:hypothetical protein Fcan01_10726 [Folsomia candida]
MGSKISSQIPTDISNPRPSLLNGAVFPFRILQFCGYFPISIKTNSPILLNSPPWYKSPPTIYLLTLTTVIFVPFIVAPFLDLDAYTTAISDFVPKSRNTFLITNTTWLIISIFTPALTRYNLFINRSNFCKFWQTYCTLVDKIETFSSPQDHLISANLLHTRVKFLVHFVLQIIIAAIQVYLAVNFTAKFDHSAVIRNYFVVAIEAWVLAFKGLLTLFSLHGVIYFVTSYDFCVTLLANILQSEEGNLSRENEKDFATLCKSGGTRV